MWKWPLYPFSWLFGGLVALKNRLFDLGWKRTHKLDRPVISVGNLSMGGAGKSPVVGALIELLEARGLKVAVLSRGYGRRNPKAALRVDRNGDWQAFGDEPMMLAKAHPRADILVGPSRHAAAMVAADHPPDVYVVDDGFQHRQLARDLDLVLMDVNQGLPKLFPAGLFRESLTALKRAHLLMLTRSEGLDVQPFVEAVRKVTPHLPIVCPTFEATRLRRLDTGAPLAITDLTSRRVAALAGIARPEKFFKSLEQLGLEVAIRETPGDHNSLSPEAFAKLLKRCEVAQIDTLVTTEKDAVKLEIGANSAILLCSLSLTVSFVGEEEIHSVLDGLIKADS